MPVPSQAPTSAVQLHRARFLDYTPSPITAISFAPIPLPLATTSADKGKGKSRQPASSPTDELGCLVLARDNGSVETWVYVREDGIGNWVLDKVLPPTLTHPTISLMSLVIRDPVAFHDKEYSVPKLEDLRLFTAGSESTELVERCLHTGRVLNLTSIPSAPIWGMAVSPTHSLLCLSTTAPTLSFFSIPAHGGPLEPPPAHLLRSESVPSRTKTVSIAWAPPKVAQVDGQDTWVDTYLITGHSDSSFRKWQLPSAGDETRASTRISLAARGVVERLQKNGRGGRKTHGAAGGKGTIVWGVAVLPDHTIATCDSLGSVTFWDGASMAQKQTFSAHKADGLCMAVGPSGKTLFTAGPDQRVCQFACISSPDGSSQWIQSGSKRVHSHDIRSLAIFPPYTPFASPVNPHLAPVLASGGWDMSLAFSPAAASGVNDGVIRNPLGKATGRGRIAFDEAFSRKMAFMGGGKGSGRLSISRKGRMIVGRSERGVAVWRIMEEEQGWEKLLDMDFRLRTHLISTAVSDDGRWLAVSDLYETKLFRLVDTPTGTIEARRVKSFLPTLESTDLLAHLSLASTGSGSSALLFTPDSQRLVMALTGLSVLVVALPRDEGDDVRVMDCFAPLESHNGRVIAPAPPKKQRKREIERARKRALANPAGTVNGDEDVEMDGTASAPNGHAEADDAQAADLNARDDDATKATPGAWRVCLAASEDGQWLSTCDLLGRVAIYNLDTLRLHAVLPTLPITPCAIAFPPAHPSLLAILTPTGSLQFCHLEHRRLLPSTAQVATLNAALAAQYAPVQSMAFEPTRYSARASKVVIWSHDWICSVQLDLELVGRLAGKKGNAALPHLTSSSLPDGEASRSMRRKRAREARDALAEMVSLSGSSDPPGTPMSTSSMGLSATGQAAVKSSANDPEFFKIQTDRYRSIAGVDWFGEGEMVLLERPYGDFVGELPQAFWSGSFGRS